MQLQNKKLCDQTKLQNQVTNMGEKVEKISKIYYQKTENRQYENKEANKRD